MKKAITHLKIINRFDEYETPDPLFKWGCNYFGIKPKLDICGTAKRHKVKRYFTKKQNALEQNWSSDFWLNPPYSNVYEFMKKAYEDSQRFKVRGLCLVYNKTDTRFFHDYVLGKADIYFIKGRVKFWRKGKETKNAAPYGSMFVYYDPNKYRKIIHYNPKPIKNRMGLID